MSSIEDTRVISVIHPSRGRPDRAKKAYDVLAGNAERIDLIDYRLVIDADDNLQSNYIGVGFPKYTVGYHRNAVDAVAAGAEMADGDILMVLSDDFDLMPKGWDTMIRQATAGRTEWALKVFDTIQPWLITMPIMDRACYEKLGYVYNPLYVHLFVDTDLASVCDLFGLTIIRNDIVFPHNHWIKTHERDSLSYRISESWLQGQTLYLERASRCFDICQSDIKGKLNAPLGHIKWMKVTAQKMGIPICPLIHR